MRCNRDVIYLKKRQRYDYKNRNFSACGTE